MKKIYSPSDRKGTLNIGPMDRFTTSEVPVVRLPSWCMFFKFQTRKITKFQNSISSNAATQYRSIILWAINNQTQATECMYPSRQAGDSEKIISESNYFFLAAVDNKITDSKPKELGRL